MHSVQLFNSGLQNGLQQGKRNNTILILQISLHWNFYYYIIYLLMYEEHGKPLASLCQPLYCHLTKKAVPGNISLIKDLLYLLYNCGTQVHN